MKEQKLTIRVSQDVLDGAMRYAREHGTTLTRLVTVYLERLGRETGSTRLRAHHARLGRPAAALSGAI